MRRAAGHDASNARYRNINVNAHENEPVKKRTKKRSRDPRAHWAKNKLGSFTKLKVNNQPLPVCIQLHWDPFEPVQSDSEVACRHLLATRKRLLGRRALREHGSPGLKARPLAVTSRDA